MADQSNHDTKKLAYAVLGFLDEEFRKPNTSADSRESLEVAMQCLETAFGVTIRDVAYKPQKSLREMYEASSSTGGAPNMPFNFPASISNLLSGAQRSPSASSTSRNPQEAEIQFGEKYVAPPPVSAEIKQQADACKDSGNSFMKDGLYNEALKVYTEAVRLDGSNAVYFCNRAAAYIKLEDLPSALRDVQIALQLDPGYARAYGRMGVIHSTMGNHQQAYSCYKKANDLDPSNDSYANNLRVAAEVINNQGAGGGPGDGFPQGPSQFASIFQNPALLNMATQMLQDPAMQNMMRSLMTNLQTGGAAGGQGAPGFEQLLQMGQAIANQIGEAYPDAADEMSGRRPGGRSDQDPPQNDSYDL